VAEHQRDAGFYDLLASESRLTSLLAIAKGDVPVRHWRALGRPFFAVGASAGLRSWTGSMFEYLMPSMVLDEPYSSVLHKACHAALREQIAFAKVQGVPWGISESAYAASDFTLAYQYAPHGTPRLALRRTPPDELVIAPYATALAALVSPHSAVLNFEALQRLGARRRYGFIEALDYSAESRTGTEAFTAVDTFMAHHQGMSIVALANVLLNGQAQRWGMVNAHLQSVSSLLHERVPREIPVLNTLPEVFQAQKPRRRSPGLLREILPGTTAIEPTHALSNGRYSVLLRANGSGYSSWGTTGITRWRDDALRDNHGSFFYLHWDRQPQPYSITQHPAPDTAAHYQSVFHADRVCFDAQWADIQAHTTVWISPEDDIEFRQIELRNLSERSLDVELISAFDVCLSAPRSDEAHPAFANLFVTAQWLASHQALWFERKPRLPDEQGVKLAHFLTDSNAQIASVRVATDRQRWRGRNHDASQVLASCDQVSKNSGDQPTPLDTGLDPVCALAVTLSIAPQTKVRLTFATTVSLSSQTLHAVIDKYRQVSNVQRASLMSATLTGIRLRALRISAETFSAMQTLTTALALSLTRVQARAVRTGDAATEVCNRRLLWRFGISGDRPIILVLTGVTQGLGMLRSLSQALNLWSWSGLACDMVVINAEPTSYLMALHREVAVLHDRHIADCGESGGQASTGFYLLSSEELSIGELSTLHSLARVVLHADGRPLAFHVQELNRLHEQAQELRLDTATTVLTMAPSPTVAAKPPEGKFADSGEFSFETSAAVRPLRPWINVLANPTFGAQLSEAGGGYTWAINSRLNQLTAWSNDPVCDPPSEWFLLQNSKTREIWRVTPCAGINEGITFHISHGQGYSVIRHSRGELEVKVSWCVDRQTSIKQIHLSLLNRGSKPINLRLIGFVEWLMGASRSDRSTVRTSVFRQRLPPPHKQKLIALLSTQRELSTGFGGGTAFLCMTSSTDDAEDWTCDRRECFDSRGRIVIPDHFGQRSGDGLDPCAVLSTRLDLRSGQLVEHVFLMGYAESAEAARQLATLATLTAAQQRIDQVVDKWKHLLGNTCVKTPDPLFDTMVNHWLLYQAVSCRLWAKAGFYQAGGATGFRDQLQDTMAMTWAAPELLREQILVCASRQFIQGDVQHWWHAPLGNGVRTHISDDLLWLAHACVHYLRTTGDATLLDQCVAFLEGPNIPAGSEDIYNTPSVSADQATVYEHAARAIDRSLQVGVNGLPLMGSGDWNDGMNRVGIEGRGESVWLGWFLCQLVADFAPLAHQRGDSQRAIRWESSAVGWKTALSGPAWDGDWFKRAFFDDGQSLGSKGNPEAQIDLIAQTWSVLSHVAPPAMQRSAMAAVEAHLVDAEAGLIQLLAPPLVNASPSAGYIQAYPPGVRENGGQYSHAGVWALMAQAELAKQTLDTSHSGDTAYRYFTYLSPAHRASHPLRGPVYGLEPYVMAGDIYSQPPYVGRGGWSWYTGAAAWLHRAAIESIFGLVQRAHTLTFNPCLPSHWPQAELTLKRDQRSLRFILIRTTDSESHAAATKWNAKLLQPGQALNWFELTGSNCFVIPLVPQNDINR
jgi:cyclic beta-1,2-glucan synthetase